MEIEEVKKGKCPTRSRHPHGAFIAFVNCENSRLGCLLGGGSVL